jgi:hypothetical protein
MAVKSFAQLVAEGNPTALKISEIMASDDYMATNQTRTTTQARHVVSEYFRAMYGTGPADGATQNNNVDRGGHNTPTEYL